MSSISTDAGPNRRRFFFGTLRSFLSTPKSVFFFFLLVYLVTWPGHFTTGDGAIKVDWARGLLFRGSSQLDPAIGGDHAYSFFPVGHTLMSMPSLIGAKLVRDITGIRCEGVFYTVLFVLNGALFLYLVARYLWPLYGPRKGWQVVAILGLASIWWPYTKMDFSDPIFVTVLFGSFLLLRSGKTGLGMFLGGLGWNLRAEGILFVGMIGVWHLWRTRRLANIPIMVLAILPATALNSFGNWLRWDTWAIVVKSGSYQGAVFDYPIVSGLFGILLSPGKGIFWFTPPLLLGLAGWSRFRARKATSDDAWLFLGVFTLSLALYSRFTFWTGDDSWGARYMLSAVMFMTIPLVEVLDRRVWVTLLTCLGVSVQLLAVTVAPLSYVSMIREGRGDRPMLNNAPGRNPVDIEEMWFHPHYSQLSGHWTLVRVLVGMPPKPHSGPLTGGAGLPLYDCFPQDTWRRHANPDFLWWGLRAKLQRPASTPSAKN